MKRVFAVSLLVASLVGVGPSHAQVPETMSYQGVLTNGAGTPLPDGAYNLTFALYDVPTDGIAVWTETQTGVQVSAGVFSVQLGAINPIAVPFAVPMWFGVAVGVDPELAPRIPLASTPYAFSLRLPFAGGSSAATPSLSITNTGGWPAILANPRVRIEGVVGTIELDGDSIDDASVILPGNAISAPEMIDEAGVASATSDAITGVSNTSVNVVLSRTIDVPADGYVMAIGTCDLTWFHSNGFVDNMVVAVSASATTIPPTQDLYHSISSAWPTGLFTLPVTVHGLFQVSAGSRTFHLLFQRTAGGGVNVNNKQLTLAYFPTAYGVVTPTIAQDASAPPATNAGLTADDIAAEQREAEAFRANRIQRELAALRAKLDALDARSRAGAKAVRK